MRHGRQATRRGCRVEVVGRPIHYVSHEFYRVENGLFAEERICSDMASLFRQLG